MIIDLEENRLILQIFKKDELGFEECLKVIGIEHVDGEERDNWRFAYDNALNWDVVEEKFGNKQNNLVKAPLKIKLNSNPNKLEDLEKNKHLLHVYKKDELAFEECLIVMDIEHVDGEERDNWRFAYDNALNWDVVEEKFGNKQNNLVKAPLKIKLN